MRYVLVSAAAAMALVGAATLGNAQAPDDKSKGPAAEGRGSAQDSAQDQAPQREPGADKKKPSQQTAPGRSSEPRAEGKPEPKSEPRKGAQRDMDKDQPKATDRQPKDQSQDRPKSTDAPGKDRPKATEQKPKDQPKATDRQPKDQPKSTDAPQPDKDRPKATEQKPKDQPKATDRQPIDQPKSTEGPQQGKERVQVSEQQRTSVREKLVKETRVEKTRINVSVNIGTTIPRTVRLHTLPVAIVTLAPAYRGYSYIVLEDETICIVEPRTYVIVDVIAVGSQRADRPSRTQLSLSPDQMHFIFTSVPKERRANVRVRLALGAEVPRDVELLAFPGVVTERVPEVQRYRYIVTDSDVVIVDPNDNGVALVINE